jgi:response regulator NasT
LEQLKLIRDQDPTPVLMVAQDPKAQSIQDAVASGVCAYSVGDVSTVRVKHAIEVAMATFASFKMLRDQLARAREQLSEQKRIDRAKCYLIEQKGLSEEEAHKALRKLAMDRKRKLADVADDLIAMSKLM